MSSSLPDDAARLYGDARAGDHQCQFKTAAFLKYAEFCKDWLQLEKLLA